MKEAPQLHLSFDSLLETALEVYNMSRTQQACMQLNDQNMVEVTGNVFAVYWLGFM